MATSDVPFGKNVRQMVQIILIMLGVIGLIAIIALVLGSIAYANLSTRSARRDALFYAGAQRRANGTPREPVTLYTETVDKMVAPGTTEVINSMSIDTANATISSGTELLVSLTVHREGAADAVASGRVSFVNNTTNFSIPSMTSTVEAPVSFTYGQVAGGGMHPVSLTNTGVVPLRVTRVRVLAITRWYEGSSSTGTASVSSTNYRSPHPKSKAGSAKKKGGKRAPPKKRGLFGLMRR